MLGDISAGTVLAWDSAVRLPQEELDRLCDDAADILSGLLSGKRQAVDDAILMKATGSRVFVRSHDHAAEVLCSLFAPGVLPDDVIAVSRDVLSQLNGGPSA